MSRRGFSGHLAGSLFPRPWAAIGHEQPKLSLSVVGDEALSGRPSAGCLRETSMEERARAAGVATFLIANASVNYD